MPWSKKPRRAARKPTVAKAKKVVAKAKRKMVKKNMDTFYLRPKFNFVSIPSQGVQTANYINLFFPLLDPVGTVGVTQNAEFNLYRTMYDRVRINSLKVTVTPKANVFSQDAAQNDGALTLTGDGMIHHVVDRDGAGPTNIAQLQRYGSYRKTSIMKKFTRSYSVTYPSGVWLDCQSIYSDTTLLSRLGLTGGITMYAENLVEDKLEIWNEPWADCVVEFGCVFQGKTIGNISLADDGSIVLKHAEATVNVALSQIGNISGSFQDTVLTQDASGTMIDVHRT